MKAHVSRYQEIAETLGRHGLGFLAASVGIGGWIRSPRRAAATEPHRRNHSIPVQIRLALEELGPTFVKLGQLLSTRPDILPGPYIAELSKLQDAAPPIAADVVRGTIRAELGGEPEELFAWFDMAPLASASIGQAHAATLHDGTAVVVKVRRPDAVRQVQEDLEILQNLADRASRLWEPARAYNLRGIVQEFSQTIRAELDYLREGSNAERFAADFERRPEVSIPRIFWERTTSRVLTLERMTGIKINDLPALDEAGIDRHVLAKTGANVVLRMVFEDHFFHADPHPGNLFVHPDGSIALIDFGMVGEIGEDLQDRLVDFLVAFTLRNPDALVSALLELSLTAGPADRDGLRTAMISFVREYEGRPLKEINFTRLASELLTVVRQQRLQLPREIALVFKVLVTIEGIGVQLDPDFDLIGVLTPYARRLMKERLSPAAIAKRVARASAAGSALLLELPARLRRIVETVDRSGFEVHIRAGELRPIVERTERIGNRLVVGMIAAALINAIGGVITTERRWHSRQGTVLTAAITMLGTLTSYLVWTGRRRGR